MNKKVIEQLFTKFLSGNISPEERRTLENWYASVETDEGYLNKQSGAEKEELENKLLGKINQNISVFEKANTNEEGKIIHPASFNASQTNHRTNSFYSHSYKIAAVFMALVILAALSYKLLHENTVVHSTAYGQMACITLPDSSVVILNGNSTLKYEKKWASNGPREVNLDGEAFFSVRHMVHGQKFIVKTSDSFNVEVLGTKFNVSQRESGTRVVLNSGRILLNITDSEGNEQVVMKPGELIEFKKGASDYIKRDVNVEAHSSWKDKKLVLDHTSLREILTMLRENYGVRVTSVDQDLLDQKVSGSMPAESLNTLLNNIAITYGIKISKNKNSIEIMKAPEK